ncbi:MAG: hypothetical protein HZB33_02975 [Nitrospirae bacterium]|nr:hypothetical protein [Nitrospirota bacterium]
MVSREMRRGGIFEVGIIDIARKKHSILDKRLAKLEGSNFSDGSKRIRGFHFDDNKAQYVCLTLDIESLGFSEATVPPKSGYPVIWHPDYDLFLVRHEEFINRRGRVTYSLVPEQNRQFSFTVDSEVADGNTPNFGFVGWFKK